MKKKLQVFISSTFSDLQEERQAAVSAILKAGHIPAGMELFTAADRSQMDTIKEWIDESDVYMLILGGRYGTIEKTSGISYTELEYDYAQEQGKASFSVVITDQALEAKIRAKGTAFGEKDNPKELALFREKVLSNISSFFDDHKDIKLCVHESLADFLSKRELKGWVSGADVVDTAPLFEEIKKLSEDNRVLREAIQQHERNTSTANKQNTSKEKFHELRKLLRGIDIKIPADLANGKEASLPLLDLFYNNRDTLINGVTNAANGTPAESFFYHNVCPKLQVHGLVTNEKVPGVRYRRSFVSAAGNAFLAEMQRIIHLPSNESKAATKVVESEITTNSSSPEPSEPKKRPKKPVKKQI